METRRASALLCGIFFASGASALAFESLWFRQAGLAFGNSVWASSLVLAAFMAGLALGNALAARGADRIRRPLRAYAWMEVAVGAGGVLLVALLPLLTPFLAPLFGSLLDRPWLLNTLRLCLAFLLLLIPSTAMGWTLPLLARVLGSWGDGFGKVLGRLYGWNTLGAVTGALLTEGALLGVLGVRGTALVAGSLNVACASAALRLSEHLGEGAAPGVARAAVSGGRGFRWTAAAALTGAILLALEVVWFRFLSLYVLGYALCFAVMLAVVLCGIAFGGLAGSFWLSRDPSAHRHASASALLGGTLVALSYAAFPIVSEHFKSRAVEDVLPLLVLGFPLMFPASFLSGLFFTLAGAGLRREARSDGSAAGRLTLWNTAGAALGAVAAGFLLLPFLGVERSLFLLAALYGLAALLLLRSSWKGVMLPAAAFVAALALFPWGAMVQRHVPVAVKRWEAAPGSRIVAVREGLCETAIAVEAREFGQPIYRRLVTNSISMSGTGFPPRRYMDLFVRIPQALHPRIRKALLISYGVGVTARALTEVREAERIDVVDISPDILGMAPLFAGPGGSPLADPRVRVHVEDGRFFLQTSRERYDLITGEPPPPQMAGIVNLYSREYFRLVHARLAEGGMVTYWLPLHAMGERSAKSILRAFADVFPDATLWAGSGLNVMLMGSRGGPWSARKETLVRPWGDRDLAEATRGIGLEWPEQLPALFLMDADAIGEACRGALPVVDDFPKRIEQDPPPSVALPPFYQRLLDSRGALARLGRCAWARTTFPSELVSASVPYFGVREMCDQLITLTPRGFFDPGTLHGLLTRTDLEVPVWLLLGSSMDYQRAARDAGWVDAAAAAAQYHAGVGLLAEHRFEEALAPLERAAAYEKRKGWADALRICALKELDRSAEAEALSARLRESSAPIPPLFWELLGRAYGQPKGGDSSGTPSAAARR